MNIQLKISRSDTAVVKGIAILAMLIHHTFAYCQCDEILLQLMQIGKVCVALFVLLSGYGLSVAYKRISAIGGG